MVNPALTIRLSFSFCLLILLGSCQITSEKKQTIGVLVGIELMAEFTGALKQSLEEYGYREGQDISYDIHVGDFAPDEMQQILEQFKASEVDIVVTLPTHATLMAKELFEETDIPVVFGLALIEGLELVDNLVQPGREITGVRYPGIDLVIKRLEFLQAVVPDAKTILVPHLAQYPSIERQFEHIELMTAEGGLNIVPAPLNEPEDFLTFVHTYQNEDNPPIDAIFQIADPVGSDHDFFRIYGRFALEHGIPVCGDYMESEEIVSVFGINADIKSSGNQTALIISKILAGASVSEIPILTVEQTLTVNVNEINRLGLVAPESMLRQASRIIK